MSFFDQIMPDFSDPNSMAAFGALGNMLLTGGVPIRGQTGMGAGNALAMLAGSGMQGAVSGAQGAQQFKGQNIGNQLADLSLQQQQAIQPGQIAMLKRLYGNQDGSLQSAPFGMPPSSSSQSGGISASDTQFAQAYQLAMASGAKTGDFSKAAAVLQSWAEHNPALAGQIKNAQEQNTYQKTPQGTYQMPSQGGTSFGAPAPPVSSTATAPQINASDIEAPTTPEAQPLPPPPSQIPNNPFAQQPPRDAAFMPPQQTQQQQTNIPAQFLAADGKPIIPQIKNIGLLKSDPQGMPSYNTPNTETGVALQKDMQKEDIEANAEMTSNMSNIQKEQYRLQQLVTAYKGAQSGTFMAQYPEVAKGLVAAGYLSPDDIHNLSMIQKAIANQAIQVIQQTKDANANLGDAPMRMFGSELANMQKKAENAGSTPEANFEVITDAMGLANHAADMYKGWDAIGGLGNRLQNGTTLRPANYARQFIETHNPQDYKEASMKAIGQFKGQSTGSSAPKLIYQRVNGKLVPVQ